MRPNIPLILTVAFVAVLSGMALAMADRDMPLRDKPEKYGTKPAIVFSLMLISLAGTAYLAGRVDGES